MAHSCPDCGQCCYCGGDIDDCCFEGTPEEAACVHCYDKWDDDDDEPYEDDPLDAESPSSIPQGEKE